MLRYLIPAFAVLAFTGCTDKSETTTNRSDSTHGTETNSPSNTGRQGSAEQQSAAGRSERTDAQLTAGDQSEKESDRTITQEIRKSVVGNSDMSTSAKNITIITIDGVVTLRGAVATTAERRLIERKANEVSGVRRINNNLEVSE